MKRNQKKYIKHILVLICFTASMLQLSAQTDIDAIMMSKNNFCIGPMYSYSSWKDYWEGDFKRDNANLGTVSSQMFSVMGNYGITDKLNVLFGIPYVQTKASQGTLHGQKGVQDLNLWVKWMPIEKKVGKKGLLSVYGLGGLSFPVTNYVADMLPLSIGLRSTNFTIRGMADYQIGDFFATGSASYVIRSNIHIDRTSYYTDELILSDEVEMPNAMQFNFRTGYRTDRMIAEAIVNNWTTLGGFDITKNNMPFPSNKMNATTVGVNLKYNIKAIDGLSLIGGGNYVVAGRNVGQATTINAGIFYILNFSHKQTAKSSSPKTN